MEDQIRQILLGVKSRLGNSVTSLTGNILIQGEEGSGKTVFATSLIKAIEKVAECDEIVIDDVDVLMMINVVHDYLKDNYRIFDDCK